MSAGRTCIGGRGCGSSRESGDNGATSCAAGGVGTVRWYVNDRFVSISVRVNIVSDPAQASAIR